tara:strand:+ start:490 stop:888 length:399 start_codon:yes stop_codon:yes gene_type:complete
MWAVILCCVAATNVGKDEVLRDRVDVIELNHFYDDQCRLVFDQWLFYDWDKSRSEYVVMDWRLRKSSAIVMRNHRTKTYSLTFADHKMRNVLRKVTAISYKETWTQYDPELINREVVPQEQRRELRKPPKGK